ncbi:MAG: hypothetical protein LLG01_08845 [Planctomycetaceae bacterium]|nr:hypothetical protein [Planctomycetaceae bacterium]
MSQNELLGSLLFVGMAIVTALIVFLVLRGPTRMMLGMNSRLAESRAFFVRVLFVMLVLLALAVAAGRIFTLPADAAFMEYVWQAAGALNGVVAAMAVVVGSFAIVMLVLLLGLGRYRDE